MNQQQKARKEVRDQVWAKVVNGRAIRIITLYGHKFEISVESNEAVTMKQPKRREINRAVRMAKKLQVWMRKILAETQGGKK